MSLFDLERESEELEQTLQKQLELVKKDSGVYLQVAGIALISGLVTAAAYRLIRTEPTSKSKKPKKAKKNRNTFWSNLRNRVFWLALDIGKQALIRRVQEKMEAEQAHEQ
ncbi:hypothetical protein [Lunatimonas salinarum]|uniref:hypothetical protein n=1 Tax=Lunatimonas salinarum TaxID=1774590 RepID=UPI001AE01197|nr:hypothetical protein [Lunatimonas salinarum]